MIGKDGWCKNFDKASRTCKIYEDRPRFCRVEPEVLKDLFDIPEHKVDKEACSLCRDSISDVYGCKSRELKNFERLITSLKTRSWWVLTGFLQMLQQQGCVKGFKLVLVANLC
ncbi:hypothetical protein GOP47_0010094 [Adiantum capillus-veneris]|uniref:Zinc/iron-chelating domain-containing protein n=1 Tax=Adiantum capillus-veneris TaxID=13818 RepID=A0A9D4UV87_ADICA|nr:hypothetical protein GOP47_0010094 [Adiantum capillus-veneris]